MTCSNLFRCSIEFLVDLLCLLLLVAGLILWAGLASTICVLLMLLALLKLLLTRLLNLCKRMLTMNNKLKLSLSLMAMISIGLILLLTGCANNQPAVAAACPKPISVPKVLMQPPANSAELAKVLSSTPTP